MHAGDAAFVDQVREQLHFVQAIEVRQLRRRARLDLHFPSRADEMGETAAEDDLLAIKIALRFDLKR